MAVLPKFCFKINNKNIKLSITYVSNSAKRLIYIYYKDTMDGMYLTIYYIPTLKFLGNAYTR